MSVENKEQKIQVLNNGSVLFIPKVDRNAEPVEQGYINSVEIGKEYLASFVYFGNETLSFVFQESGILGNQDRSGEDLVIGPEYARMPHDEAKKFMDIKKDSALNNLVPFNNCVVRFEVEYATFQYPDARDPRPYSEYKVFVNIIHNPAQTEQPLVKIYAGNFTRVSDDRVEVRGDAQLHSSEVLLGFLNTEELTNDNDPRNQQGLVGGDKDAGTPIPQIERKIPGISDSDTESDTESDTDSDEPFLNEKADEAFILTDENHNEVGEFRWDKVPPAEEHHPLSWILSIYDTTQQSWRNIVQITDRLYKRLLPLRYYSRDELLNESLRIDGHVGGETKQHAQDIVAIFPPGFPQDIEYSYSFFTFDKYIFEIAEDRSNIEYLYQLVYNKHSELREPRYFLFCIGERPLQQEDETTYYESGDERRKMYMTTIPESFLLKLKNEGKVYNFESYKQLKMKIERRKNQDGESKSRPTRKRRNTIGGKKKTNKKRKKFSKKRRKRRRNKTKKQFLYNPNNPKKSFDVYIDKNPSDTIPIKYTTINDVKKTIRKLERLYKAGKYSHKRIWQVGMIMKVRLDAMMKHRKTLYKKAKNVRERRDLAKKYFLFLRSRSKEKNQKLRKVMKFKIN